MRLIEWKSVGGIWIACRVYNSEGVRRPFHIPREMSSERTRYEIFETADLPLKLIPATLLCLISAFLDFLSGRKLKVCSMYSDFQKIERKK